MRHSSATGRHSRPPRVPLRTYLLAALALCAAVLSVAGLTGSFSARAAVTAPRTALVPDRPGVSGAEVRVRLAQVAEQARLRAAVSAAARAAAALAAHTYTVRAGQSMSDVARLRCAGKAADWTGIYAASRALGWTAENANVLSTGQHLWISCAYDARQLRFAPAPPPPSAPVRAVVAVATASTGHTYAAPAASSYSSGNVNPDSYSGFQRCVITRESGGNSQVMNSSGHYGLYQFSASTWAAYGGSAASFGHASAAEQTRVFDNAMARGGQYNWSPYDGC